MIKKLLKTLPLVAFFSILLAFTGTQNSYAQCTVDYEITFDPPVPANGAYDAGTTVEVCIDINNITLGAANWLSGIEFLLPPGWDTSSLADIDAPEACANGGTWIYYDALSCGGYNLGPGFYYDVNSGGPEDGNPCNNFGDPCFTNADWSFCADITLDADCGGAGNPLDGELIVPGIAIYGDGDIGSWGLATPCVAAGNNEFYPDPAEVSFELNCCDSEVGESPGTLPICENGTFCLFDELIGTPDPNGIWEGPAGWVWDGTDCGSFDPTVDPPGEYTYSVIGTGGCVNSVTINMEYIDLGIVQTIAYCDPDPTCLTDEVNTITLPPGGTWFYPDGTTVAGCTVDPTVDPAGEYVYEFFDGSNCLTYATLDLLFSPASSAGCPTTYDYCSDADAICPFDWLGCNPNGGGQWALYDNNDVFIDFFTETDICLTNAEVDAALPGSIQDGFYFVYLLGAFPCAPGVTQLDVNYFEPFDPGTFTQTSICVTDPLTDLVTLINGTPDPGGTFTSTFDGSVIPNPLAPSNYSPGDFLQLSYSGGLDNSNCFGSNIVEITFLPADADAGDPNEITVCESDPFFNMIDSLGGTPQSGGTWTNPSGTNTNFGNFFTPGNPNSPGGIYTYTVSSSCDSDVSTLEIIVIPDVDAGTDGTLDICDNETGIPLSDGQATPGQAGGTWFDATFNPVANTVDGASVSDGDVYSYVISSGPCADTAEVVINLTPAPNAGVLTTAPQAFCETDGPLDLMTLFTTNPSEINPNYWSGPGGPTGGTFDPASDLAGTYGYTIPDQGCGPASVSLVISLESQPNAGTDGNLVACPNDATPVNLISLLAGAATGGTWSGPSPLSGGDLGTFDPSTNLEGDYEYTITSSPNGLCTDQATVNVTFETLPDPGTNGTITLCESSTPVDLFTVLNGTPDNGGNWSGPSALGGGDLGTFNPSTVSPGAYIYTYGVGVGSCPDETAQVQVIVETDPNPGVSGTATVCESFGNVSLNSLHTANGPADIGGSWTDQLGNPVSESYNVSGQCGLTPIVLTYTVDNGTCSESADLTLTVECLPDAGPDEDLNLCGDGTNYNLNNALNPGAGTPGTWLFGGNPISGNIVLNSSNSGIYVYEVSGSTCAADQAQYNVTIDEPLSVSGLTVLCEPNQTEYTVCFDISGGDGNYIVSGVNGTPTGSQFCSDPIPENTPYNITVSDGGPCPDINVNGVSPDCNCTATATITSGNETICTGSSADIIVEFNGVGPFNFVYTDGLSDIPVNGVNNPYTLTVTPSANTTYSLVSMSDNFCDGSAAGSVNINLDEQLDAGPGGSFPYCGDGTTLNLNDLLPTGVDPGSWSGGPVITLNTASAGPYTYTTNPNACPQDAEDYIIVIEEPLSTSGLTALCEANQTEYTVCFDIAGGDGNYTVIGDPGLTGTLVGNQFCSDPIPEGTDYSFTISSNGLCPDITVSDDSPDCNCTAQGSITGSADICAGNCANITFNLTGTPPFDVTYDGPDGVNQQLNGISDGHVLTVCPTSGAVYTLTSVSDALCDGSVVGSSVTVNVDQPVFTSNIQEDCDPTNQFYTLTFEITGGNGNYQVNPQNGSPTGVLNNGIYEVDIESGEGYSYDVTYGGNSCGPVTVESPFFDCGCATDAGSVSATPLFVCEGECTQVIHFGNEFLDGNDILQFVLHDGTANDLGNVLATSNDGEFCFNNSLIVSGETYFISAVAGNNVSGNVDLNDPCLSVSTGVEVTQNALPSASIFGGNTVCPGEQVDLTVSFTGIGPWDFRYSDGTTESDIQTSTSNTFTLSVTQPGTYTITEMSDSNCTGSAFGQAVVQNFQPPSATISGDPNVCEGSGDGPLVEFNGTPPFSFTYAIDGEEEEQIFNVPFDSFTIPADVDGNYTLVSLSDNNCQGSVSGSIGITMIEQPTATITGGGVVCEGDEATFNVNLTGDSPWTINYTVDGLPNSVNVDSPNYSFESGIDGDYVITSVQDLNCQAEIASQASLVVNPLPTAELNASSTTFCIGQEVDLSMVLNGNPPFNVTYSINGDTISASGIQSSIFETLTPDEPVLAEVIFIEDGSDPVCTNQPDASVFIVPSELPNAPTLQDESLCSADGRIQIGVTPVEGLSYTWSPESNLTDPDIANPEFVAPNTPGIEPVEYEYIITASNGDCEATDTMSLVLEPGPLARFSYSPDPVTTEDTRTFFTNNSLANHNTIFYWEFDTLETSFAHNPMFMFPDGVEARYSVSLTATDTVSGCFNKYTERVNVRPDLLIFVPTAFTPDQDGLNDLWGPVLSNIDPDNYRLTVVDRWGEVVFQTRDPKKKWNGGKNNSDYFAEPGVYIWLIETKEVGSLEEITQTGQVTLVR